MNRFFVWCSGADVRTVLSCESSEQNKYINVGMVVFFVALLASLSATFFVTYAFDRSIDPDIQLTYVLVGLLWGLVIISLDRSIVATINKEDTIKKQLINASPRFLIAVFIGLVISTPLEMKIFSKEINDKLRQIIYDQNVSGSGDLLKSKKEILDAKSQELATLNEEKNFAYNRFRSEIRGGTTGWVGYGPKAKDFESKYDLSARDYNAKKLEVDSARLELKELRDRLGTVDSVTDEDIAKMAGVEMRVKALYSLNFSHLIITFLFILFETLPMIVKLMMAKGNYERFVRDQKELFESAIIDDFNRKKERTDELDRMQRDKERQQIEIKNAIETKLKAKILSKLAKVQKEMAVARIAHFKKRSLDTLYELNHNANDVVFNDKKRKINGDEATAFVVEKPEREDLNLFKIALHPDHAYIKDKGLEEVMWRGIFKGIPSRIVFHAGHEDSLRKLTIRRGVKTIANAAWGYVGVDEGKIALDINGKRSVYRYDVANNLLNLTNNQETMEFDREVEKS